MEKKMIQYLKKHDTLGASLLIFAGVVVWIALSMLSSCTTPGPTLPVVLGPSPVDSVNHPEPGPVASHSLPGADESACRTYRWKSRGQLPASTVTGIAAALKRTVCLKRSIVWQPVTTSPQDGLAIYRLQPSAANVYALLLSSAAYESSGNVCEGRDQSAGPETSITAESGLFQQSGNVQGLHPALKAIVQEYQAKPSLCDAWKTTCSQSGIVGSGPVADFQRLMRSCPMLATEQSAIGMRVGVRHWGPARRGQLEVVAACQRWLASVESGGC